MFSIGEFARHGRVSIRMLRHYDATGLLRPAFTDPGSGYRFYRASQLADLNRVIALKELGFTLQQVQRILDEQLSAVPVGAEAQAVPDLRIVDLAAVESAAVIFHHGSMEDVLATGQALARWIDAHGYRSAGYAREVTLECPPDRSQWVTELQQPIYATGG
jgi:DNA-binding transcriptional MerR regulator